MGGDNHRAEDDARRCGKVFLKLLDLLLNIGISEAFIAKKLLDSGAMFELFSDVAESLKRAGTPAEPPASEGYSQNLLISNKPDFKISSIGSTIEGIFHPQGYIAQKFPNYEWRPKQAEMAKDCADAFNQGDYLMAEAGTGTGKSFAYLIPAILFSIVEKCRVVVSTNTKNLQEQLFYKDIPLLVDCLPFGFQSALLKGRANYICLRKWFEILIDPGAFLSDEERIQALCLLFWINRTTTGDIAENNGFRLERFWSLWSKVVSEAGNCLNQRCPQFKQCFLQKARNQASKSNIVVVNHALMLTDISADNAVLGEYHYLVVDEAHNLEKAASNHLGLEINIWTFRAFCNKLYRKDKVEIGLLFRLRQKYIGDNKTISDLVQHCISDVGKIRSNAGELFAVMGETARTTLKEYDSAFTAKKRYGSGSEVIRSGIQYVEDLLKDLTSLEKGLKRIAEALVDIGEDILEESSPGLEAIAYAEEAKRLYTDLTALIEADDADWVYWWELPRKENNEIQLFAAPLNPKEILVQTFYPFLKSVIFTSATLKIGDSFEYYRDRLGLNELEEVEVECKDYGSPFDYERQALFGAPTFIPGPKSAQEFTSALAQIISDVVLKFRRGTLVLFTSYSQLNQIYNLVRPEMVKANVPLLAQGIEGSRSDILRRFLRKRALLLGTDSFWEGIDAPGEALEILIVAKLPFDVPTEPLIEARMEKITREGRNAFAEYSLPEAVIRLRQGVGRLIRSNKDKGVVLICDNRIVSTGWGGTFRQSLPKKMEVLRSKEEVIASIAEIFDN
jgi:predicted DnaQ family exonuclease/DinG family helicase